MAGTDYDDEATPPGKLHAGLEPNPNTPALPDPPRPLEETDQIRLPPTRAPRHDGPTTINVACPCPARADFALVARLLCIALILSLLANVLQAYAAR